MTRSPDHAHQTRRPGGGAQTSPRLRQREQLLAPVRHRRRRRSYARHGDGGYSAVISSAVMPAARQSKITLTSTRVPAITVWPCITGGRWRSSPAGQRSRLLCALPEGGMRHHRRSCRVGARTDSRSGAGRGRGTGRLCHLAAAAMPQAACRSSDAVAVMSGSRHAISFHMLHHPLAMLTKSRGAKRGANGDRHQATQGDTQRRSVQLTGTSGDAGRRPATEELRLTSEGFVGSNPTAPTIFE